MGLLNRNQLLTKETLKIEKVMLNEEDYVFVRQMTGFERDAWEQTMGKFQKVGKKTEYVSTLENFRSKLAVNTVCDEDGNLILTPADVDDFGKSISAEKLERIIEVAQRLNKISEEDKEELTKNSEADLHANSSSGSAVN